MIRSQKSLAKSLGLNVGTVSRMLRRSDCPAPRGPWTDQQVKRLKVWRRDLLQENRATPTPAPLTRARTARTLIQAAREKLQLEVDRGMYHRADECQDRRLRKIVATRQALMHVPAMMQERVGYGDDGRRLLEAAMAKAINKLADQ